MEVMPTVVPLIIQPAVISLAIQRHATPASHRGLKGQLEPSFTQESQSEARQYIGDERDLCIGRLS